ncbi:ORF184 [Saltwater crocodilepox virus]|nr:ORF184 [Saltwater crocodilepox virus]QGT47910.1 ORF184 [Saltwater crocodilepox virus]QGT48120.1 ORF184 [Saltwater crocodilepox virus]QGT48335.1 ORF184 [Saltwater crocodilepox virus]QGT48551.1 ORF184 [Saltwater crocodilepox virus]
MPYLAWLKTLNRLKKESDPESAQVFNDLLRTIKDRYWHVAADFKPVHDFAGEWGDFFDVSVTGVGRRLTLGPGEYHVYPNYYGDRLLYTPGASSFVCESGRAEVAAGSTTLAALARFCAAVPDLRVARFVALAGGGLLFEDAFSPRVASAHALAADAGLRAAPCVATRVERCARLGGREYAALAERFALAGESLLSVTVKSGAARLFVLDLAATESDHVEEVLLRLCDVGVGGARGRYVPVMLTRRGYEVVADAGAMEREVAFVGSYVVFKRLERVNVFVANMLDVSRVARSPDLMIAHFDFCYARCGKYLYRVGDHQLDNLAVRTGLPEYLTSLEQLAYAPDDVLRALLERSSFELACHYNGLDLETATRAVNAVAFSLDGARIESYEVTAGAPSDAAARVVYSNFDKFVKAFNFFEDLRRSSAAHDHSRDRPRDAEPGRRLD